VSFQAYIDNIHAKTGCLPDDFRKHADAAGLLGREVTATEFTDWLKADFGLGHGHAMAMLKFFKDSHWINLVPKKR
jgi:Domain of unknown function (DUF4287)